MVAEQNVEQEKSGGIFGGRPVLAVVLVLGALFVVPTVLGLGNPATWAVRWYIKTREKVREEAVKEKDEDPEEEDVYIKSEKGELEKWATGHLHLPAGMYYRLRPSPDRKKAVAGIAGGSVFVDLEDMTVTGRLEGNGEDVKEPIDGALQDYSYKKKLFVTVGDPVNYLMDPEKKKLLNTWEPHRETTNGKRVRLVRFFSDGTRVLVKVKGKVRTKNKGEKFDVWLEVWRVDGEKPVFEQRLSYQNYGGPTHAVFSEDGKYLAVSQRPKKKEDRHVVRIRDAKNPETYWELPVKPEDKGHGVHFYFQKMEDGKEWLVVNGDPIEFFPLSHIKEEKPARWHTPGVGSRDAFDVFPDGEFLLGGSYNSFVLYKFLEAPRKEKVELTVVFSGTPAGGLADTMLGPDGDTFYVLTGAGTLWRLSKEKLVQAYREKHGSLQEK